MKHSEKLIQRIREQEIKPVPRRYFIWRNTLLWAGFILAALLGAVAFSVVLFSIQQTDFNLIAHLSHSRLEFFLGVLPFFWIISLIVFLITAMTSFKHSPKGYKLTTGRLAAYCTALSILLGTLLFLAGGGQRLEHAFGTQLSLYESVQEKKAKLWSMPQEGYLSGTIQERGDTTFTLQDFNKKTWTIQYTGAFIPPVVLLEPGEKVKIIGKMNGKDRFSAAEIRPWGGGMGPRRGGPRQGQ